MTLKMLDRQIKRYGNDAVRFKKKADRCYAAWKEYGDRIDYLNSQQFYEASKRADSICKVYQSQRQALLKG